MLGLDSHDRAHSVELFTWIDTGELTVDAGLLVDPLSMTFVLLVTFVGTLIHVYSMAYMRDDPRYPRFFLYLSLFCFSMLGLVAADSIFLVFVFWELVGICSYLLIGFWYEEKANADAANKAFVVNRVGDVGMLIGLGALWACFGTFSIEQINTTLRDAGGLVLGTDLLAETLRLTLDDLAVDHIEDSVDLQLA